MEKFRPLLYSRVRQRGGSAGGLLIKREPYGSQDVSHTISERTLSEIVRILEAAWRSGSNVAMPSFGVMRISTTRVAPRIGLAQPWTYTNIVDASGNSHWACSVLDSCGYERHEWQLARGMLNLGLMRISTTRVATRIGPACC